MPITNPPITKAKKNNCHVIVVDHHQGGDKNTKADAKETVKEYKIQKSADTADHADAKSSPVASNAKSPNGANAKEIAKGGAEEKGRPAPTAAKTEGDFANTGGKDSLKTTEVKADHKDGADASAKKSPVVAAKK